MKYLIQDLIKGDNAKKVVVQQDSLIAEKDKQLTLKDSVVFYYQQKDTIFKATTEEFGKIEAVHARNIQSLQIKVDRYRRQRNVFAAFTAALLVGLIVK